jgi:class 3 adenylate cyclase
LAAAWQVGEREAVELCLEAVKAGLLGMEWNILCPRCRGAKTTATTLEALPEAGHCDSCDVAYGRDFSRNVELTFHPAPAIRPVAGGEFCLFGPMSVPHVKLQQTLKPGETRHVAIALPPGDYRLRPLNSEGGTDVSWAGGGFPTVIAGEGAVEAGAAAEPGAVVLVNRGSHARTVVVEDLHWQRDALTAHRVTSMQTFRDLFEAEVLRPGDEVAIERVALMFTDLRGSTALYTRIGDARAYQLVRQHFAYLAQKVRLHNGAIVKTIGDAVMAAFADPGDAMRAALDVQRSVAAFNAEQRHGDIVIKLGLHEGPSIAVTLNGRLDYFGTTVNMAARLQAQSEGGDIVLSRDIAADPAVAPLLAGVAAREQIASLKGFDAPVPFLRIDAASLAPAPMQPSSAAAGRARSPVAS